MSSYHFSNNRIGRVAACVLLVVVTSIAPKEAASKQLFYEDFDEGRTSLRGWISLGLVARGATSGDLVFSGTDWGAQVLAGPANVRDLRQTSVRAHVAYEGEPAGAVGLVANADAGPHLAYQGGINTETQELYLGWNDPGYVSFNRTDSEFDLASGEEIFLQLDVIDNHLQLWAWPVDGVMPDEPQLTYYDEDLNLLSGEAGVLFDAHGVQSSGIYRQFELFDFSAELGDFNEDSQLDLADVDMFASLIQAGVVSGDLNEDGSTTSEDLNYWVTEIKGTWIGDSNLDGEFNSSDMVQVFKAQQFEDSLAGNSVWSTGDWNGDSEFTSADFVAAFIDGGYEQGPKPSIQSVPEPPATTLLFVGLAGLTIVRRRAR